MSENEFDGVHHCPGCARVVAVDHLRARFRVSCGYCGLQYELTGAAFRTRKRLPGLILDQIKAENARGRVPCISMPDLGTSLAGH